MAEGGVLEGVLGGEEERLEAEALEKSNVGAVAFAAAVAANQVAHDPAVSHATEAFLKEQTRLLKTQREEIVEQSALRLAQLASQYREGRVRRVGQAIRVGMQGFLALVIGLIAVGFLVMLYDAFASRQVIVEAFKAPPALASRGVTGAVVAAGVLDTLRKLQDATRSPDKAMSTTGAWASDVKIEVPDTGVSLGEIIQMLHQRFGHDLHIEGELTLTGSGGLELTVRGDGVPAAAFTGGPDDLAKLTTQAAEYVYGRSQPRQYGSYLNTIGRYADAVAFIQGAFPRATNDEERTRLANTWANAYASLYMPAPAAEKYRLSMSFAKPRGENWWKAWGNLVGAVSASGGEEAGRREGDAMLEAAAATPGKVNKLYFANPGQLSWDLPLLLASERTDAERHSGKGASTIIEGPAIADTYGLMHDERQAARYMAISDPDDPITKAEALLLPAYAALDRGDYAAATPPLEAFYKAWLADTNLQYTYNMGPCSTGLAVGMTGRVKEAEAMFRRVNWSLCYASWGQVLAHAGDAAGAAKIWAQGEKTAPSQPAVPLSRGLYELGQGRLQAAEADVALASRKSPHWADPLKAWGDVLAREGRWNQALAKYDEAMRYAPAWPGLQQARAVAAKRAG